MDLLNFLMSFLAIFGDVGRMCRRQSSRSEGNAEKKPEKRDLRLMPLSTTASKV